jgi:glutaminase
MVDTGALHSLASSITAVTSPFRNYLNDLYDKYRSLDD